MGLAALLPVEHQARPLQDAEMLRHRRLRDPGAGGERADRLLALPAQPLEQRPPCGVAEGSEQDVVRSFDQTHNSLDMGLCIT